MNSSLPKILIAAPTSKSKKYCFEAWLDCAMKIKYPNIIIRLFDNSSDGGVYSRWMNEVFANKYGRSNPHFSSYFVKTAHKNTNAKIADSSNAMRQYFLNKKFDYLLCLESDVMPQENTIEELLYHQKKVIGALYDRDEGRFRKLTVQKPVTVAKRNIKVMNLTGVGETRDEEIIFIDGTVKQVSSVGLGCVLIKKDVLEKIEFRFDYSKPDFAPDSHFSEDCFRNKIKIFSHTGIYCNHYNKAGYWFAESRK